MLLATHVLFSLFLGVLFFKTNVMFFGFMLVASIMPDLDIYIPFIKHRGIFHSITAGLLLSLVFIQYSLSLFLAFFLGFCSHLFADSLTKMGVKPFWPFSRYNTDFGFITTGKFSEQVFAGIIFVLLAIKLLSIVI